MRWEKRGYDWTTYGKEIRRHGQPGLETQVDVRRADQRPAEHADGHGAEREDVVALVVGHALERREGVICEGGWARRLGFMMAAFWVWI